MNNTEINGKPIVDIKQNYFKILTNCKIRFFLRKGTKKMEKRVKNQEDGKIQSNRSNNYNKCKWSKHIN